MTDHPKRVSRTDQLAVPANFEDDNGKLYLVHCAACGRRNYAANIVTGCCTWCGWQDAPVSNIREKSAESVDETSHNDPNDAA